MTPQEFYSNVGDRFGVIGGDRVNPHRGVDFPWGQGTPIPSWCNGTVVRNEWNSVIGWILAIETSRGWAGFCHMASQSPLPIGSTVSFGQTLGAVGNTGSASRGAHLHATFSAVGNHPGTSPVVDPLPWITTNLSTSAGGGTSPFPSRSARSTRMSLYHDQSTLGSNGSVVDGKTLFALAGDGQGEAAWLETTTYSLAETWSAQIGGPSALLTHDSFLDFKRKYLAGGTVDVGDITIPPVDNTAVLERLDALLAATKALNPPG